MNSYLFYDLETSGLNKCFDQIIQFAAIRTDMQLNEIERFNFLVRLSPDTVVSPGALITHRISVEQTTKGMSEYDAARTIHRLLNQPGTISLGYNTLGFDDEFLRFTFHRNLLPPYTHQYSNGCRRMDLYPIAIMYQLYRQEVLVWPEVEGKVSLKLEGISQANALAAGNAHDALVDVEATLALTRCFRQEMEMWNYLSGYFVKKVDQERTDDLPIDFSTDQTAHTRGIMINGGFGADMNFQAPVLYLGRSRPYANQSLWLRLDLPELRTTTRETLSETPWVIRKRYGEPGFILPPLERYNLIMGRERMEVQQENLEWLKSHPDIFRKIVLYFQNYRYPEIPNLDAEAALYQMGFMKPQTDALCRHFHEASPAEKAELVKKFREPEIRQLAIRILARNFPDPVPAWIREQYRDFLSGIDPDNAEKRIVDFKGRPRVTPSEALQEIRQLRNSRSLDEDQMRLLDELEQYLKKHFVRA